MTNIVLRYLPSSLGKYSPATTSEPSPSLSFVFLRLLFVTQLLTAKVMRMDFQIRESFSRSYR